MSDACSNVGLNGVRPCNPRRTRKQSHKKARTRRKMEWRGRREHDGSQTTGEHASNFAEHSQRKRFTPQRVPTQALASQEMRIDRPFPKMNRGSPHLAQPRSPFCRGGEDRTTSSKRLSENSAQGKMRAAAVSSRQSCETVLSPITHQIRFSLSIALKHPFNARRAIAYEGILAFASGLGTCRQCCSARSEMEWIVHARVAGVLRITCGHEHAGPRSLTAGSGTF